MKKLYFILFVLLWVFVSCKNDANDNNSSTENVHYGFEKDSYDVIKDKTIEIDVDSDITPEFEITNEKICEIVSSQNKTVRILGKKSGATVLKAVCNDKVYKTVINVMDSNKSELYLVNCIQKDTYGYITTSFFRMNNDFIEVQDNNVVIKKENGTKIITDIDNFISLEAENYKEN